MPVEKNIKKIKLLKIIPWLSFFIIFFLVLGLPHQILNPASHDLGSQVVYEYWLVNKFQFGKDIVQNIGPLGFLLYPGTYSGFLVYTKLYALVFVFFAMACVFQKHLQKLSILQAGGFFLSLILIVYGISHDLVSHDAVYYLFALLLSLRIVNFEQSKHSVGWQWINIALLVVLSLTKGTLLIWAFFTLLLLIVLRICQQEYKKLLTEISSFGLFFVLAWLFSHQVISNIPAFFLSMLSFSSGYNDAMTIYEGIYLTLFGLGIVITYTFFVFTYSVIPSCRSLNARQLCNSILLMAVLFLVWKHGYVRADGHVMIFLQFCMIAAPLYIFNVENISSRQASMFPWVVYSAIMISITYASCTYYYKQPLVYVVKQSFTNTFSNIHILASINKYLVNLEQSLVVENFTDSKKLTGYNNEIENKNVGYWGMKPGIFAYQNFKYASAPSNINFASYNAWIMNKNRHFYHDNNLAPDFVFVQYETIDNQLISQNDSLAQLEIIHHYLPLESNSEYALLKRKEHAIDFKFNKFSEKSGRYGEWMTVPQPQEKHPIWVQFDIKETLFVKVMAFLYKPPEYEISIRLEEGNSLNKKYISQTGKVGFMLSPLVESNEDLLAYYASKGDVRLVKNKPIEINIHCVRWKWLCGSDIAASFSTINNFIM